jgi:hypothetical protein
MAWQALPIDLRALRQPETFASSATLISLIGRGVNHAKSVF